MILINNRDALRLKDRELLNRLSIWDGLQPTGKVITEQAKTGALTLQLIHDEKTLYLQSKYDPQREAQRFASKFDEEIIRHVLFVGIGAGYHIQAFMESHPDTKFSIYEPNEEVLHAYLSNFQLDDLPLRQLVKIFTGTEEESVTTKLQHLLATSNNVLKIITLPVYEKIYGEQIQVILEKALESIKEKHSSLATNVSFQKRWTINSIKNFPKVLQTPNILHDIDRSAFEGKPAIIVAAGPSLNEEFENLRYIKEHGLAYIFSVGSAINALIEQGIYPDAACTYDPKERNQNVIKIIKDKNINDIPLIFGTSVGHETLKDYPGKMLHMITSQDSISSYLVNEQNNLPIVNDAPSIAIITFQLLARLGFTEIMLVGQNLSFRNNERFAKGIQYAHISNTITNSEKDKLLAIKDVFGELVYTNDMFERMKDQLELYVKANPHIKVINTTKNGAHIEGTIFRELKEIIKSSNLKGNISNCWFEGKPSYSRKSIENKLTILKAGKKSFRRQIVDILSVLESLHENILFNRIPKMVEAQNILDKKISVLDENIFYKVFIKPMLKNERETLNERVLSLRYEREERKKSTLIFELFQTYIKLCDETYQCSTSLLKELEVKIGELIKNERD